MDPTRRKLPRVTDASELVACGELDLPNHPSSVPRARRAARALARRSGCSAGAASNVALAVTEATTNALIHGYARRTGRVHLMAEASATQFVVTITDTGSGLTPRTDSPGLGVGLAIIAEVTEDLEVETLPTGGTRVRMAFRRS